MLLQQPFDAPGLLLGYVSSWGFYTMRFRAHYGSDEECQCLELLWNSNVCLREPSRAGLSGKPANVYGRAQSDQATKSRKRVTIMRH
jgi:hypothetical protein